MNISPITLREARTFIRANHRHRPDLVGGLFAIAVASDVVHGVAVVGRPTARHLDADDFTAEITRVCTDGTRNACSMLYGACWRAARALGYRRLVTYTLATEVGASLRASGFRVVAETRAQPWHRPSRPRIDVHPAQAKLRWERSAAAQNDGSESEVARG
jgi:hypothetical protein